MRACGGREGGGGGAHTPRPNACSAATNFSWCSQTAMDDIIQMLFETRPKVGRTGRTNFEPVMPPIVRVGTLEAIIACV